jgi:hypothetical protein
MSDPDHHSFTDGEFLSLRIGGDADHPARLLLIGRPRDGIVHVREWSTESLNTEGADLDIDAAELLADIERAYESRFEMSEEMYKLRVWLGG